MKFTSEFNARFPSFATDVLGFVADEGGTVGHHYVVCVQQ